MPGYDHSAATDHGDTVEAYGWWRHADRSQPPEYIGLDDGLQTVAQTLIAEGPFDGVVGFSQGAALAAMVASLLGSADRSEAFRRLNSLNPLAIPFPSSFRDIEHPPLKFCVVYSGFVARGERYHAFYEPHISTPSCHFVGSLDNVVEESRSRLLIEAFGGEEQAQVVYHPGGHFLPNSKQFLNVLVGFIKSSVSSLTLGGEKKDAEELDGGS